MLPTDTDPAAAQIAREVRARVPRGERLRRACEASDLAHALALCRLRALHPDWPDAELRRALLRRLFPASQLPEVLR
jgi:hypothetical protein